jgi:hypothetical protein
LRELVLGESVASVFLVAEEHAQLHGGAVGEFFDVGSSDYRLFLPGDVLGECL